MVVLGGGCAEATKRSIVPPPAPVVDANDEPTAGECVDDLRQDALRRLAEAYPREAGAAAPREEAIAQSLFDDTLPDVDGDGIDETLLAVGFGAKASVTAIYATNGGCMRSVGVVVDGELRPTDGTSHGHRDLEANWSGGCAGHVFHWTRYRFDGRRYVAIEEADCDFCPAAERSEPLAPDANRARHCVEVAPEWTH